MRGGVHERVRLEVLPVELVEQLVVAGLGLELQHAGVSVPEGLQVQHLAFQVALSCQTGTWMTLLSASL